MVYIKWHFYKHFVCFVVCSSLDARLLDYVSLLPVPASILVCIKFLLARYFRFGVLENNSHILIAILVIIPKNYWAINMCQRLC